MAGCATPGINIGSFDLMPKRLREWATTWAVSPIAKISGWSGTDRSELTMILPDLSVAEFIHPPAGEARTPAPPKHGGGRDTLAVSDNSIGVYAGDASA